MNGKWETKQLKVSIYFQEINKKYKKTSQLYAGDPDGGVLAAAGQEVVLGAGPGAELEPGHRGLVPAQHLQEGPGGASLRTWGRYIVVKINREYRHMCLHTRGPCDQVHGAAVQARGHEVAAGGDEGGRHGHRGDAVRKQQGRAHLRSVQS